MTDLEKKIASILAEWRKGCSVGPPGACEECTLGALWAIDRTFDAEAPDYETWRNKLRETAPGKFAGLW